MLIPYAIHTSRPPESLLQGGRREEQVGQGAPSGHSKPLLCPCKTIQVEPAVKDPFGLTSLIPPSPDVTDVTPVVLMSLGSEDPGKIFPQVEEY